LSRKGAVEPVEADFLLQPVFLVIKPAR